MKRSVLVFLSLVIAVLLCVFFYFRKTYTPAVSLAPESGSLSARRVLNLGITAPRTGLKKLTVTAVQGEKTFDILTRSYAAATHSAKESLNLSSAGLKDGPFELRVRVTDSSIYRIGAAVTKSHSFVFDSKPLVVTVISPILNIARGGAGVVVYSLSKEVEKSGILLENRFFPGYRLQGDFYACFFPYPYNMAPGKFLPRLVAVDRTGEERQAGISFHPLEKAFSTDRINLTDPFLEKTAAEFRDIYPQAKNSMEIFLKANGELRRQDAVTLSKYGLQTSPTPLWQGTFLRMSGSAQLGSYAQDRTYLYNGSKVDQQTHLGIDLASLARAPVAASNRGKVIHAGRLGLYGQCVIIDHGLGLQTLYAHLSGISVKVGELVEKGHTIGNTGATGMAGGDHLHYGMFLSGEPINPIEWWDPSWIRNNVTSKLEIAKAPASR